MDKENQKLGGFDDTFALMTVFAMALVFLGLPLGIVANLFFFGEGSVWSQLVNLVVALLAVVLAHRHLKKNPPKIPMLW